MRKSSPDNAGCHLPTAAATKSTQGMQATQAQPLSTAPPKPLLAGAPAQDAAIHRGTRHSLC